MVIKVLSSYNGEAKRLTEGVISVMGHTLYGDHLYDSLYNGYDLNIAPDYETILTPPELSEPRIGTLIFHPSPLPRMRGRNAIKRQYKAGDIIGGGTWFWASEGIDNGEIFEQEIVILNNRIRPSEYYLNIILPLMVRTLGRALLRINGCGPNIEIKKSGKVI